VALGRSSDGGTGVSTADATATTEAVPTGVAAGDSGDAAPSFLPPSLATRRATLAQRLRQLAASERGGNSDSDPAAASAAYCLAGALLPCLEGGGRGSMADGAALSSPVPGDLPFVAVHTGGAGDPRASRQAATSERARSGVTVAGSGGAATSASTEPLRPQPIPPLPELVERLNALYDALDRLVAVVAGGSGGASGAALLAALEGPSHAHRPSTTAAAPAPLVAAAGAVVPARWACGWTWSAAAQL
jgi:hypothetical protein